MTEGLVPRIVRMVLAIAAILAILITFLAWRYPDTLSIGYTKHELGSVGPADRDMLYKVKQAGLWEMPVGMEMAGRATSGTLRAVGQQMADEHHQLDLLVVDAARQLGVQLPNEVTPDQSRWMKEISALPPGNEYDHKAVFYLRAAHGKILPLLAQVKAGTRNEIVRQTATTGIEYVSRHMAYLESTGLVNYAELPEPPTPSPYQQPAVASYWDSHNILSLLIAGVVAVVLLVILSMIINAMLKSNTSRKPPHVPTVARERDRR